MLAHLRYFGLCFNPVAFYYCYAADGTTLDVEASARRADLPRVLEQCGEGHVDRCIEIRVGDFDTREMRDTARGCLVDRHGRRASRGFR